MRRKTAHSPADSQSTSRRPASAPPVLVCFAVREEARFFKSPEDAAGPVSTLLTGMGSANAAASLRAQVKVQPPGLVLTCGFAGGLNPALAPGALVFSTDADEPLRHLLPKLGAIPAVFHSAERVAVTAEEKRKLRSQTGADAVEMESGTIRQICQAAGVRCVTIRVISDTAEEDLPLDFNALLTLDFQLSFVKLAWAVLRDPASARGLWQLHRRTQAAARQLGDVLPELARAYGRGCDG